MSFRSAGALSRALRILLAAGGLLALAGIGAAIGAYLMFVRDLPDLRSLADYHPALASRGSTATADDQSSSASAASYAAQSVPPHVVNASSRARTALLRAPGVDITSILRAWVNLRTGGEIKQGGSTITQQMVKGLLLSPERTYQRKIREMILARNIEKHFSKQEILYLYLNQIYFGHGAYGIGEAAQTYFGKDVSQLTLSEGAQLAGLPKAPSRFSPYADPEAAEKRRRYVLGRMLEEGLIDASAHDAAVAEQPKLRELTDQDQVWEMAYFTEQVRRRLVEALGNDTVLRGGLTIETARLAAHARGGGGGAARAGRARPAPGLPRAAAKGLGGRDRGRAGADRRENGPAPPRPRRGSRPAAARAQAADGRRQGAEQVPRRGPATASRKGLPPDDARRPASPGRVVRAVDRAARTRGSPSHPAARPR
jgi:hypothetical protein